MPKLTANTIVIHPQSGTPVLLAESGDLPDWAVGLVGDHLLDRPVTAAVAPSLPVPVPAPVPDVVVQPPAPGVTAPVVPPRGGPGSAAPAWRSYAASVGVEVDPDASRDDVIAALEQAGKPTE